MKKFLLIIFTGIMSLLIITNVNALEGELQLVGVGEVTSFSTDSFDYNNISYVPTTDSTNNYGVFNIESVTNKSNKSLPISIDILLFDKNKKNIGFLTYCTDEDYSSSYAQYKLKPGTSSTISIIANKKYFVDNVNSSDLSYYAVYDDNKYCHVGGFTKYKGLTLEEIKNGNVVVDKDKQSYDYMKLFYKINFAAIIGMLIGLLVSYIIVGIILNALNKRMNAESSVLAYLPIGNNYISVKLAFGDIIAKWYILAYVLSIVLYVLSIRFLMYILSFVGSVALIIDIVKLITKKYDLLVFNPAVNNNIAKKDDEISDVSSSGQSFILNEDDINNDEDISDEDTEEEKISLGSSNDGDEMIDLNYSAPIQEGTLPIDITANKPVDKGNENDKDNGGSDLRNFFN